LRTTAAKFKLRESESTCLQLVLCGVSPSSQARHHRAVTVGPGQWPLLAAAPTGAGGYNWPYGSRGVPDDVALAHTTAGVRDLPCEHGRVLLSHALHALHQVGVH